MQLLGDKQQLKTGRMSRPLLGRDPTTTHQEKPQAHQACVGEAERQRSATSCSWRVSWKRISLIIT